jgi:hypothetical protein
LICYQGLAKVFDVIEHLRLLHTIYDFIVLPPSNVTDVRGNSGINDDVIFDPVFVRLKTTQNEETTSRMQLSSILAEGGGELGKRECVLIDMTDWLI